MIKTLWPRDFHSTCTSTFRPTLPHFDFPKFEPHSPNVPTEFRLILVLLVLGLGSFIITPISKWHRGTSGGILVARSPGEDYAIREIMARAAGRQSSRLPFNL